MSGTIEIVAALIRDRAGRVLLVRKRGTTAFMQPGGKRDSGEQSVLSHKTPMSLQARRRLV